MINARKILGIMIAAVLVLTINYGVYRLPDLKIDLSKNQINSLSGFTKKTINQIDGVVEVRIYATYNLPGEMRPVYNSLRTVLKSMESVNRSKFKLQIIDPQTSDEAKKEMQKFGIQELQFSTIKSDKFEVQKGYFGLVMIYKDKHEVLPIAGDVSNFEYLLISGIKRLSAKSLSKIAIFEDGGADVQSKIQYLRKYLSSSYNLIDTELDGETDISKEATSLVIVGRSKKVGDKGIKQIEKWLEEGKPTIVFLDRYQVGQNMMAQKIEPTGLEALLEKRGIKLLNGLVTVPNGAMANFRSNSGSFLVRYPYWLQISSAQIDRSNPTMSGINQVLLPWVSPLELSEKAKPLLWTDNNGRMDETVTNISPTNKVDMNGNQRRFELGAIVDDQVKLGVIGDADFISDQFVSNNSQNLGFALNLVDYLSGDEGLFEIRSKTMWVSTMRRVDDQTRQWVKYGNMMLPMLILAGVYWLTVRYRSSRLE